MVRYALVILAGGASSRMGTPKALLAIGGETFASCIARKAKAAYAKYAGMGAEPLPIYLVTGPDYEVLEKEFGSLSGIRLIRNLEFERGQISSIQAGLRVMDPEIDAVMVWPVDLPLVREDTIELLMSEYDLLRMPVTIPVFGERRGHPVVYDRRAVQTLLSLQPDQTAKDLRTIYADQTCLAETKDSGVLIDIDMPEDYRKHITDSDS